MPQIKPLTSIPNHNIDNVVDCRLDTVDLRLKMTSEEDDALETLSSSEAMDVETTLMADEDRTFVHQPLSHPKHALIDGELWPSIFEAELVRSAKNLVPYRDDVFVVTYPKCGTTWIQHICSQLMVANYKPGVGRELYFTSPMIEHLGAKFAEDISRPRILKTHFAYESCPRSAHAKYIYAARNPKDCLISYFHHYLNFICFDWAHGEFSVFFNLFAEGRLGFGDYFDHLNSWLPHIHDSNVLFLKYEDMCESLEDTVRKIGHFLGGGAAQMVDDAATLDRVVRESSLDAMKCNQNRFMHSSAMQKENAFIRKGGSRGWKKMMTREQSDIIDALYHERMAGTEAADWWEYEMRWNEEKLQQIARTEDLRASKELTNFFATRPLDIRANVDASDASSSTSLSPSLSSSISTKTISRDSSTSKKHRSYYSIASNSYDSTRSSNVSLNSN